MKDFIDLLKLPPRILGALTIASGLLLFLPDVLLSKLYMIDFRNKYGFALGITFVVSASILLVILAVRLNYNDKFLEPALFQWESMANVSAADVGKQQNSDHAYLFIRKVSDENGIVLPFIYVGKGKMTNPRRQVKFDKAKGKDVVTYLYDIVMENELPDYLQYDFGLTK